MSTEAQSWLIPQGLVTLATQGRQALFQSALLFAAIDLDLFAKLSDAAVTKEQTLLLNALVSVGVLQKNEFDFRITPEYESALLPGPACITKQILGYREQIEGFLHMDDTLLGKVKPTSFSAHLDDAAMFRRYLEPIRAFNAQPFDALVAQLVPLLEEGATVLDLGGGHGALSERFLEQHASARVTVMDLPGAIENCAEWLKPWTEKGRLTLVAGDAIALDRVEEFDMVVMSDLLHYFPANDKRTILKNAWNAAKPEGFVVVKKLRLSSDGLEPQRSCFFALQKFLSSERGGYLATDAEMKELLAELLGERGQVRELPLGDGHTGLAIQKE